MFIVHRLTLFLCAAQVDRLWQLFFTCIERAEKHKLGFSSGVISPAAKTQGLPSMDQ